MTKRNGRRRISPPSFWSLSRFLILSHLTVGLLVSRVRTYLSLSTNQQHGISCFIKRGPLPDWPVWTRGLMLRGVAAENQGGLVERREGQSPPSKPHGENPPPLQPYGEHPPPLQPHSEQFPPSSHRAKRTPLCQDSHGTVRVQSGCCHQGKEANNQSAL